jgi:hypothetical protein
MSHVSARQEVQGVLGALGLPGFERNRNLSAA